METSMQTTWSRAQYALNVHVQDSEGATLGPASNTMAGFWAVISISLSSAGVSPFPRVTVGGDKGKAFESEAEALSAGVAAANRMLDDLIDEVAGAPAMPTLSKSPAEMWH
jgi:hypothetical protein